MTLTALIVDDEKYICALIEHLVDWEALDIRHIGFVHSGADALERILQDRPQIVISDIRMPGYNGIELMRQSVEAGLACKFILISGHRQFDYAHQAIQYGAVDYILKPLEKVALEAALRKAAAEIRDEQEEKKNQQMMRQLIDKDKRSQCASFCVQWLADASTSDAGRLPLDELERRFGFSFKAPIQMLAYELPLDTEDGASANPILSEKIEQEWERFASEYFSENICFHAGKIHYVLLGEKLDKQQPSFAYMVENCNHILRLFGKKPFSIGLSQAELAEAADLLLLTRQARLAMEEKILLGPAHVILFRPELAEGMNPDLFIRSDFSLRMQKLIQELDQSMILLEIEKIGNKLERDENLNASTFLAVLLRVTEIINNAISALESENRSFIDKSQMVAALRDGSGYRAVLHDFTRAIKKHLDKLIANRQQISVRPIQIARQMIAERYAENVSLHDIAEAVHLNPVYLSVLFKKETGENFKEYLMNYRVEVSKNLLRETTDRVEAIAAAVGYRDMKHFRSVFQKNVGLSPMQYRKLYNRIKIYEK